MPADPLVSAVVSSIISSVAGSLLTPAPELPGAGIVRNLPAESRIGVMSALALGQITVDGKLLPMSPGAQVRNELNMIILPSTVAGARKVRYQVDMAGYVYRVWILSASEASLPENR